MSSKKTAQDRGRPPKPPEVRTEGQRRLLEVEESDLEISAQLGTKKAIVGHWRRGRRLPGVGNRRKLELLYDIPLRAWDVTPGTEATETVTEITTPAAIPRNHSANDTLTMVLVQIEAIETDLRNAKLTDASKSKLRDTLTKLLSLRAKLEQNRELLEDHVVREHPEWLRLKARMLEALKPYPDAAKAVADALDYE